MYEHLDHPAVAAVLNALEPEARPIIAVTRQDVVAVVVDAPTIRRTAIVEFRDGNWLVPQAMIATPWRPELVRPPKTGVTEPFANLSLSQSGWPEPDLSPPQFAWQALSGLAAHDAEAVLLMSGSDTHQVPVREDGYFLALVKSRWRSRPMVSVRLDTGQILEVVI